MWKEIIKTIFSLGLAEAVSAWRNRKKKCTKVQQPASAMTDAERASYERARANAAEAARIQSQHE